MEYDAATHNAERRSMRQMVAVASGVIPARWLVPLTVLAWLAVTFGALRVPEPWNIIAAAGLFALTILAGAWAALG